MSSGSPYRYRGYRESSKLIPATHVHSEIMQKVPGKEEEEKDKRQRGEKKQEEWVRIITITLCPLPKKKVVGERTGESAMDDSGIPECHLVYLKIFYSIFSFQGNCINLQYTTNN